MSYEKPVRPILKVFNPRPLVDLSAAISSGLLMNETQWIGVAVRPIDYSLKGAVLNIDTGPVLKIEESHAIEMESHTNATESTVSENGSLTERRNFESLKLEDGRVELPDWASETNSVMWLPVRAINDQLPRGSSSADSQKRSIVDGMRTIALKLEFGVSHNQIFDRTMAVHFTDPFHVSTRIADKCNDGALLLQVTLHSQVNAVLTVYDAWLDLQGGFTHTGKGDGRPTSGFFPLVVSPTTRAGVLFSISMGKMVPGDETKSSESDTILNIRYGISGDRTKGAHPPVAVESTASNGPEQDLIFRSALVFQRPVLDPCLAVGFLPLPSSSLKVGQLVTMKWRIERLKNLEDEVLYEVNANNTNWMIAGRKRGHVSLSPEQGSRVVISILCVPLVAGYVHPPQLGLPNIEEANISCNPAGPHLVCVLPPALGSSFCVPA